MKFLQGFSKPKQLLSVILAILMLFMLSVPSFADLWIAPTDAYYKKDVYNLLDDASGRRKMNLFLSNFSEADLTSFDTKKTTDKEILTFLFKHFELNASLYSGVVIKDDGNSGKIMTVRQETIEKAAKNMFNRTFSSHPIADYSSYNNGKYSVYANEAGSQINVLSIAGYIEYFGDNVYEVGFSIFKTESNVENYYSSKLYDVNQDPALEKMGNGSAKFNYVGGIGASAFRLVNYDIGLTETSEPYTTAATTAAQKTTVVQKTTTAKETTVIPNTTSAATSEAINSQTETLPVFETSSVSKAETTVSDKAVINDKNNEKNSDDKSESNKLILITVFVVLAAITATIIIVLIYKKKK